MKRQAFKKRSLRKTHLAYDRFEQRNLLAMLTGTAGDDIVSVTATGDVLEVNLNGELQSFDFAVDPELEFDGLDGSDVVTLEDASGSSIEFIDGELKVGMFTVELTNVEMLDVANDGRVLVKGTPGDDRFVLFYSPSGPTVSINGNSHALPLIETGIPLQLDADSGDDHLSLRMDLYSGGSLQVKLDSAMRPDLIDYFWTEVEHVELEFFGSNTFFQLISDDVNDVLFVDTDRLTLEGASTTFEAERNLAGTAFWHSNYESNQVFVRGTENNDVIDFTYRFSNHAVEINENHFVYLNNSSIHVDGKGGDDSVGFNLDEDRIDYVNSAVVEPNAITLGDFPTVTLSNVESQAAGNINQVTILDSAGDDQIEAFHNTVVSSVGGTTWTLTENNTVDVVATGGHDTVVALTAPTFRSTFSNYLGFGVSYGGGDNRFMAVDFDETIIRAAEPGGYAYIAGSGGDLDEFDLSDPNGDLLVGVDDRTPVLVEGEMNIAVRAFADDVNFKFTSAIEGSDVRAGKDEFVVNGKSIELIDIDSIEAIGNSPGDMLSLVGSSEDEELFSGVEFNQTQRLTRLKSDSHEIRSFGFENISADLTEGDDYIWLRGDENEIETLEIGMLDVYSLTSPNFSLTIDRGDFLTTQANLVPFNYGFGEGDTLRYVGSTDHVDQVRFAPSQLFRPNGFEIVGQRLDEFLVARGVSFYGTGFTEFEVDLRGGESSASFPDVVDWLAVSSGADATIYPDSLTFDPWESLDSWNFSWENIERLGVAGATGTVYDSSLDDSLVFGPEPDAFFQNSFFPFNGLDVANDDLKARYSFDDLTYVSSGGFDTADLSVDANTLELGLHTTRATWEEVNLTLAGVEVVNATTENANDAAAFVVDVDQLDVRVSDDRNVQFTSPATGSVVNVANFDTLSINDDGSNTVSFLTDTTSNGATTASVSEVLFTQIPDSDLSFPLAGVSRVELLAGTNTGALDVVGTAEDETLQLRDGEIELVGQSYSIEAIGYTDISVSGADGIDDIALQAEFESSTDDGALVFESTPMVVRATEFESVADAPPTLDNILVGSDLSQRSSVNRLVLTFAGSVEIDPDAFTVTQRSDGDGTVTGAAVTSNFSCTKDGDTIVTLTFESHTRNGVGDLEDGNYQLTVDGSKVRRTGTNLNLGADIVYGDSADEPFYVLYGDFNGDRNVNIFDLLAFRQTYLTSTGDANFNPSLDYTGDGVINVFDLLQFRNNYRKTLPFV